MNERLDPQNQPTPSRRELLTGMGALAGAGTVGAVIDRAFIRGSATLNTPSPESMRHVDVSTKKFVDAIGAIFSKIPSSVQNVDALPTDSEVEVAEALLLYLSEAKQELGIAPLDPSSSALETFIAGIAAFHALHKTDMDPRAQEFLYRMWHARNVQAILEAANRPTDHR